MEINPTPASLVQLQVQMAVKGLVLDQVRSVGADLVKMIESGAPPAEASGNPPHLGQHLDLYA